MRVPVRFVRFVRFPRYGKRFPPWPSSEARSDAFFNFVFHSISELLCLTLNISLMFSFWKQSSGKSSVLESIVGRDFLPRGSGDLNLNPSFLHRRTVN